MSNPENRVYSVAQNTKLATELDRVRFVSHNILRLQGLRVVPFALAGVMSFLTASGIGLPFNIFLAFGLVGLPPLLYIPVALYYQRSLGLVILSTTQRKIASSTCNRFINYGLIAWGIGIVINFFFGPLAGFSLHLTSLGVAAAFLDQWRVEGSRTAFLHYPVLAVILIGSALLQFTTIKLPTSIYSTSGDSSLDWGVISATLAIAGICDHFVLMRNLKQLNSEES